MRRVGLFGLAVALALTSTMPASARSRTSRAEEVRKAEQEADRLTRANPRANPAAPQFYAGTPSTAAFVLRLCSQPGVKPSPATCRAAAEAKAFDAR